jgi:hypothetical protein
LRKNSVLLYSHIQSGLACGAADMRHKSLLQRFDIGFDAIELEAKRIAASHVDDLRDGQGEGRASHFRANSVSNLAR